MFGSLDRIAVEGLTNVGNKIEDASKNLTKIDHKVDVSEAILLSSLFFGSLYMFSTSIVGINKMFLKGQQLPFNNTFFVINGSILIVSGYVLFISGCQAFPLALRPKHN